MKTGPSLLAYNSYQTFHKQIVIFLFSGRQARIMAELSIASFEKADTDTDFVRLEEESFSKITGDSIDYAVMEKTKLGRIVKLDAGWDDVGSWSALYDIAAKDENENVAKGDVLVLETKKSYIRNDNRRPVAVIGLENIVLVDGPYGLLISDINKIQDVKKIAEQLKARE